jgi:hypothetical protein
MSAAMIAYPHRHDDPRAISAVMSSGPVVAPKPNVACIQFVALGEK